MEEMGRVLLPAPFFSSVALGALTLLETASDEQRQRLLPRIARGEAKVCVALIETDGRYDPPGVSMPASIRGDRVTLNGTKLFVVDAQASDYVICAARTRGGRNPQSGISLFVLDTRAPGITCTPLVSIDRTRRLCEVSFARVGATLEAMLGRRDAAWPALQRALDKATVALCAEMVGGPRRRWRCASTMAKHGCNSGVRSAASKPSSTKLPT
jgi:alkylation response protein AidB-like acyl-CoA dehydrogenase